MKELHSGTQWKSLLSQSKKQPIIVFKHSNACPISAHADEQILEGIAAKQFSCPVYKLVVQDAKDLSSKIAAELRVKHESPQAIVIKDGIAVFSKNHDEITTDGLVIACKMQ